MLLQDMSDAESVPENSEFVLKFKTWILNLNMENESAAMGSDDGFHQMLKGLTPHKDALSLTSSECGLCHLPSTVSSTVGWRQVTSASVLEKVTAYDKSQTWPPGVVSVNLDPEGMHVETCLLTWLHGQHIS